MMAIQSYEKADLLNEHGSSRTHLSLVSCEDDQQAHTKPATAASFNGAIGPYKGRSAFQ